MKEYTFEFTDTRYTRILLLLSLLSLLVTLIIMGKFVDLIAYPAGFIPIFAIPLLVFFLNRKKIKKIGSAILQSDQAEFNFNGSVKKISYSEINKIEIFRYRGTHLTIKLRDKQKFIIQGNSYFCDYRSLDLMCQDLEKRFTEKTPIQK
jgi:hypothetical protein